MSEIELPSELLDSLGEALAEALKWSPSDPLKHSLLREKLTLDVLRELVAHAREVADLGACVHASCERVAGTCAEHLADEKHRAWESGWHAGSGGEDRADNPFKKMPCRCGDGHCPECGEDPRIVGYP